MGYRKPKGVSDLSFLIPGDDEEVYSDDEETRERNDAFKDVITDDYGDAEDSEAMGDIDDDYSEMDDFEDNWIESGDIVASSKEDANVDFSDDAAWASDDPDGTLDFDAAWFVSDQEESSQEDGGQEGPVEPESFQIDEGGFDKLETEASDDSEQDIFVTMKQMDIALSEEEGEEDEIDELPVLDSSVSFLGPEHGFIAAATFYQGTPIGVGEQLFILGPDRRFHAVVDLGRDDLSADSIAWYKDTIFIGTKRSGVLVTNDMGKTFTEANSWYTEGFVQKGDMSAECSTSFTVTGHFHPAHFRLFGRTGEGQLYVSEDGGASWRGLLLKGCCAPLAVSTYSTGVFALTSEPSGAQALYKSYDLEKWDNVPLPPRLVRRLAPSNGIVASSRKSIAVAAKNTRSLYLSVDNGLHFKEIRCPAEITAILLNRESPDVITVGVAATDGSAHVLITFDRGRTWELALSIEPSDGEPKIEITSLCASVGQNLRILAVSSIGAHLISFAITETKH